MSLESQANGIVPRTAIFVSGPKGAGDWYTGPVQISLVASEIGDPSAIISTTYNIDGIAALNYSVPLTVAGDGVHTIQFGSVDKAGNIETPRPSAILKIDSTSPTIQCVATPNRIWPPNGQSINVSISGNLSDAVSGIDPSTVAYKVIDDYGQVQPSGAIALTSGGSFSFGVPLIAARNGNDKDGRKYTISVTGKDLAGNPGSCTTVVTVPHNQ